jgi:membrane protease YdiL (CAAX protease family)
MTSPALQWTNLAVALAGPLVVAVLGTQCTRMPGPASHAIGLAAIVLIVTGVYAFAVYGEGYSLRRLGFARLSWRITPLLGIVLAAFYILVFGPLAFQALAKFNAGDFAKGLEVTRQLPTAYLVLTILLVAPAEELLYRAYAIERISDLTGSYVLAATISIVAFALAHVPMWGWGPALTTAVSGGIATLFYIWRPDVVALIIAHIATDLYGIVLVPYFDLARPTAGG